MEIGIQVDFFVKVNVGKTVPLETNFVLDVVFSFFNGSEIYFCK